MASYQQVIELVVKGQEQLAKLERRVKQLNKEADRLRTEPAKSGTGALADEIQKAATAQKALVDSKKNALLNQIKLNSAVDLYGRRLKQIQTTTIADQAQFKGRIADIQAAFKAFKTDGDISGIQAVSTELGRILETQRELQRNEIGRNKSIVRRRDYVRQINEFKAAGLDTSKVERFLEQAKVALGTKRFKLAGVLEVKIKERLGLLKKEKQQIDANNRAAAKRAKDAAKAKAQRRQDLALGAGFPLLFGGGAGQVLGGLTGAALGGGFGGQILGAAVGQQIETTIGRTAELGRALESLDMSALADSTLLVTAGLREAVDASIGLGESQKAVEAVTKATLLQTGLFPENISDVTNATTLLSNVWDEFYGSVNGLLALLATPFVSALTAALKVVNVIIKGLNTIIGSLGLAIKRAVELAKKVPLVGNVIQFIEDRTKGVNEVEQERLFKLRQSGKELEKELGLEKELFSIESRRMAGTDAAAKLNNAQVTRDLALTKLKFETDQKIVEKRREFAGITDKALLTERDFQILQIQELANIEQQRIQKKFALDEESAALQAQKELRKQIFEQRVAESKVAQAAVQAQLDELNNEAKIFELRQQTGAAAIELEGARFNAQLSTLKLEETRLKRELDGLQKKNISFNKQKTLIEKIAQNQVNQAKVELQLANLQIRQGLERARIARQQIDFEVARIRLQMQMVRLKADEIKDDKVRAARLREINGIEKSTNGLIKEMVQSGDRRLNIAQEIARQQGIVAQNIYRGKIESIEAERVEARRELRIRAIAAAAGKAADETARMNSSMSQGAGGGGGVTRFAAGSGKQLDTATTNLKIDKDVYKSVMEGIKGLNLQRAGQITERLDAAQRAKNRRLEFQEKVRKQRAAEASQYELLEPSKGAYSARRLKTAPVSSSQSVNITTGPVMQFDNDKYVSMEDFESVIKELSRSQASSSRSYGGRTYGGVG